MHVSPAAPQCTVTPPIGGESGLFSRAKKWKSSLARNDGKSWESSLSSLPSLSLFLLLSLSLSLYLSLSSLSLSLSLSSFLSLSLSLSVSLSQGTHTQKNYRVNAHPYGGPTDFASNCIHLGGWDSWSIVTVESTHNPPEPPKASPLPENWRHASRTTINHQELEHDDDDRMQNCTETWTARKSSDTIPNTRDVLRPIRLTIGCWRFSGLWERHRIKCQTTTKSMPGKKIARKRPGSRCEADLPLRTARALPPPFLFMVGCVLYVFNAPFSRQSSAWMHSVDWQERFQRQKQTTGKFAWLPTLLLNLRWKFTIVNFPASGHCL